MTMPGPPPGKYVLFGASGLAGFHALNLLKEYKNISVLAVSHGRILTAEKPNVECVQADLTDYKNCYSLTKDRDYALDTSCQYAGVG